MKTIRQLIIRTSAACLMTAPIYAIEAPEDDAPPPPMLEEKEAPPAVEAEVAPMAFIGLVCAEVPEMLAAHLQLAANEGVVVSALQPKSPADLAGIKPHDVILRIAEQNVSNREDVARIVSAHKPGDVVRVDLFQKGKKQQFQITLAQRPKELMADANPGLNLAPMMLEGLPEDQAKKIRDLIERQFGKMNEPRMADALGVEDALRQMREQMGRALEEKIPDAGGGIHAQRAATVRMMDQDGSVEIQTNDGAKEVTVRDKQNNIVWTGPWDTEQDKAASPADVRERVERLNVDDKFMGRGLRFNFNRGAIDEE